ncbi:MAG: PTS sugar transporter subunit IIA, partial [Coprobacillaceae bacterium]
IKETIKNHDGDTLIITDIFCGTPYNASCKVCMEENSKNIEVISGMSLPIVLEVASMLHTTSILEISNKMVSISSEVIKSFTQQNIEEEEDF